MNVVHLKRLINIAMKLTELLEISNPFKVKPKLPRVEPVLNPEPEIAASKTGKISLPANAASWAPEKLLAFKDGSEHLSNFLYTRQKKGIKTSTLEAYQEVQKQVGPEHIKDAAFVQDIFEAARKSANERIAAEAEALKGGGKAAEEPKPAKEPEAKEQPTEKENPKQTWSELDKWGKFDKILKWSFWGANGAAVGQALVEYNQQRALAEKVARGEYKDSNGNIVKWTPAQMDQFARVQHVKLVAALAPLVVVPVSIKLFVGTVRFLASVLQKFLPGVSNWLVGSIVKPIEKILSVAQKEIKPNTPEWTRRMTDLIDRGYSKEKAAQILADTANNARAINRTFDTVATAFAAEMANPQKIYTTPQGDSFSLMELVMIAALEVPIFSPFMSSISEIIFNSVTEIWNKAGGQAITGWEATTMSTDLKRASGQQAPAAATQQAPANANRPATAAPDKKRQDANGVEIVNWD